MKLIKRYWPHLLLFVAAFWLRWVFAAGEGALLTIDEASQSWYAHNVALGQWYGTRGAYWSPGWVTIAGLIMKLGGDWLSQVRFAQALAGAASALFVVGLGRRWHSPWAGWLAGVMATIYTPFVFYTGRMLTETFFLFFMLASLYVYTLAIQPGAPRWGPLAASGLLLGLATLTRPVTQLLPFVLAIDLLLRWGFREWRRILLVFATVWVAMWLTMSPWIIRNYRVMGAFVPVTVTGGINLYMGHSDKSQGMWTYMGPDDPVLRAGDSPEADRLGRQRALQWALENPRIELRLLRRKATWMFTRADWDVAASERLVTLYRGLHLPWLDAVNLVPLAVVGMLIALWRRQWLLLGNFAYAYLMVIMIYFAPRYRLPGEPFLLILAALPIAELAGWLWQRLRQRQGATP